MKLSGCFFANPLSEPQTYIHKLGYWEIIFMVAESHSKY